MTHRFSNTKRQRDEVLELANYYTSWSAMPQSLRISILEQIAQLIREALEKE
jgi:acyl-CoA reductase-like NAD-dependent aldehyde dehydrogenase